jgi:pyruvate/2-oxoglutarate dehydrogenase complex dihydrolipoamide acyltransferase (E2) component
MVESLQEAAQLTQVMEVDVTAIARLREASKADFLAREGVKLTYLPFFAKAAIDALKLHPKLNAAIDTDKGEVTYFDKENLAIAVDTEKGLLTPVIKEAGDLSIAGLARKIADVAERTRTNKITPDELSGGTFTLTNTGSRGALFDTPIINQPQVAILGTGSIVKRPVVKEAGDLSIAGLAKKIADVAERTRTNKITPDELSGGTFTITNLGSFGALFDTPIINKPQVAILGPGAVVKRPVVIDDPNLGETIAVRHMVHLSLTYDHRLVDGADAGRFLQEVKKRLEAGQFEV